MDGIIALGHFCETHGPCIILCTQRCNEEPKQFPHNLTVPWCEACQSIDVDQSLVSKDKDVFYVTTRTPLQQDLAFLLKQAAMRSLSCEETTKAGDTIFFGDNERGHVLSHTFSLQDSLARGFHRRFSILILMRDKIHLLNCWTFLTNHIKDISNDLQVKASNINNVEQIQCPQRAVRQAQGSPSNPARSLSQLTGEPAIFAHLHMWFTWLLSCEIVSEKPNKAPKINVACSSMLLKKFHQEMDEDVFKNICYCFLTGIPIQAEDDEIITAFRQLLPVNFKLPSKGEICIVSKNKDNKWMTKWSGTLPQKLPKLQVIVTETLGNSEFPESALDAFLESLILQWLNIAKAVSWTTTPNSQLFQSLGVQKCDLPLLAHWSTQCNNN